MTGYTDSDIGQCIREATDYTNLGEFDLPLALELVRRFPELFSAEERREIAYRAMERRKWEL